MVAITVSVFGAKQAKSRLEGTLLSSAFVLGIVAMFTPLGVVAGLTGSLFGSALQSPLVRSAVALLFLAMAASLFGAFDVALPSGLTNKLAKVGGLGVKGAFGLGLVCGLIAAPCTGPVLTGILTYIAQSQSAKAGALLMLAFSLGLGLPFFLVGTFALQLPKSGPFMVHIKSVLAIVLAVVALYFLGGAFAQLTSFAQPGHRFQLLMGVIIVAGLALGAVHLDFGSPVLFDKARKSIGAFAVTVAAFGLVTSRGIPDGHLEFKTMDLVAAKEQARRESRPMLIDFTATWCGACKELEKHTFADPAVQREASRYLALRIDATNDDEPAVQAVMKDLKVVGLPTVLLVDSTGREKKRFNDFVQAEEFVAALRAVQ
jgi:thiol:disulfide interchange protein DsbD